MDTHSPHLHAAPEAPKVMVVDDELPVREYLAEALAPYCSEVRSTDSLHGVLHAAETDPFDVLIADVCMPGATGLDLLALSQQLHWDCAVILMTGHAELDQVVAGVRLHAADFLLKPFGIDTLCHSVRKTYDKLLLVRQNRCERELLSAGLRQRTQELEFTQHLLSDSYRSALETLVATLEAREKETYAHSFRVRAYALHLAAAMNYPASDLPRLAHAALLHDLGKVAVSDAVLLKPGPLDPKEFEVLKSHSVVGERIVNRMGFLAGAGKIIRHHHERWDGRGYPDGIAGSDIPFGSRLFAVADTLDAMTSNRCYRGALTVEDARTEILRCTGTQFDPAVAEAFLSVSGDTWMELRSEADRDANAAIIPDVKLGALLSCVEVPLELSVAIARQ
ncbi:MAG: HD-GYP domain-containing protein [Terriglobales bacterium]